MIWVVVVVVGVAGVALGIAIGTRMRRPATSIATSRSAPPPEVADPIASMLRDAVAQLDIGVVLSSADGEVMYRNQVAMALDGTHAGVILDDKLAGLVATARQGGDVNDLLELHGPPKTSLQLTAAPMPGGAAVATISDVSERVRADAIRTDFVANISHELKTPVGALAVLADALYGETDPVIVGRVAERMVDEAHRGVRAIDDLLELARIESAQVDDDQVDLDEVVEAAIARGQAAEPGRGIAVARVGAPAGVQLRADRRQLASALGNLVENAVKYSHDEGLVQVRSRVDAAAIEIMVVDQGVGIPARDLDRIFERFYRVDKARSRESGGTGLGLSIVRHVATNHGGEVLVSSKEGEGSSFVLRLPPVLVSGTDAEPIDHRADHIQEEAGDG